MIPTIAILTIHAVASVLLAAFGFHRLALARAHRRIVQRRTPVIPVTSPSLPRVTVQIPLYNERYVADRAVRAVAALSYPRDRLDIQVLDDSTDETTDRVAAVVRELRAQGIDIRHITRTRRVGFKAGALACGLTAARGEFIAVFDADFVPHPDFLLRIVPEFRDPRVGMVQARWGHLNRDTSLLTRAQALQLDAHFTLEHGVRADHGFFFNFNGTAGIWRRSTIEDAGGWQADTLTEDLDLSYRAQLAGWRFVYRDDVEVPAELPVEVSAYRVQQQRWAQGGIQTARKILPRVLRADLPPAVKRAAAWHLLIHLSYPLLVLVTLTGFAGSLLAGTSAMRWVLAVDGALLGFAMASLSVFYGTATATRSGTRWWRRLALVPVVMIVGAGISFSQSLAVLRGLIDRPTPFRRTPKYRVRHRRDRTWRRASYRVPIGASAPLELGIGLSLLGAAAVEAWQLRVVPSGLVLLLAIGLVCVSSGGIYQHLRTRPTS